MLRIADVTPLDGLRVRLVLSDGSRVIRDLDDLVCGPIFQPLRDDPALFREVRVELGALVWPGGADLDPDVVIWGGAAPRDPDARPAPDLRPTAPEAASAV